MRRRRSSRRSARSSSATVASSMRSPGEISAIEDIAYDVWCAPVIEELDGWRLRFAHGLTSRGNSVWPNRDGELPLDEKIARAEAWYAAHGLPARFQLTKAARPAELTAALKERGYRQPDPTTFVELAELRDVEAPREADVREEPEDAWVALWAAGRGFDDLAVGRALLTGSPGPTAFARLGAVAVGRGVAVGGWLGVTSMFTVPAARGRGHARPILRALVAWARA